MVLYVYYFKVSSKKELNRCIHLYCKQSKYLCRENIIVFDIMTDYNMDTKYVNQEFKLSIRD
jgi:hypothetical protein